MTQKKLEPLPQVEIRQSAPRKVITDIYLGSTTRTTVPQVHIGETGGESWTSTSPSFVITQKSEEK